MTPEGRVKVKVKQALKELDAYVFMPVQNGMGAPALDLYCCVSGNFVAVETKAPGKRLTERQRETARKVCAAHGCVFVIRDQTDINCMMSRLSGIWEGEWEYGVLSDRLEGPPGVGGT